MSEMNVEEAKAALQLLEHEVVALRQRKNELEAELQTIDNRLRVLQGGFRGTGELSAARLRVKQAEREEADAKGRLVVWGDSQPYGATEAKPYIVDKITPKRIYVRRQGQERAEFYNRDGTTDSRWCNAKIDLAKTFPEGLEAYEKANKRKK